MYTLLGLIAAAALVSAKGEGTIAHENEQCGGFTMHPRTCAKGLFCYVSAPPEIADAPGVCKPELAGKGEKCLVFSTNLLYRRGCAKGLTCKLTNTSIPDLGGVCVKQNTPQGAGLGQKCLVVTYGKKGPNCRSGYVCRLKNKHKPSLGGVCIKPTVGKKY